ncbi:hypothetical protein KIH74_12055 [Kineosporia sp. J2-2]|uniref:Secreted protein n=1 Tax=Kineosporia corallincola TaxID=2835133 RepID=A0ABS5THK0_9ACTN|nr:hypothetical protein [Kineosporia corallincola]MBT0769661.1 hypothetical protein [Kineosporia corallincola]
MGRMHRRLTVGLFGRFRLGRARGSTPQLLMAAGVTVLAMALLAGVLGWQGLARRADALERARAETAQQVRIQTARTSLVIADTAAGTDVLTGADPTVFRYRLFAYKAQNATIGLVTSARTDADAATLATANNYLTAYAMQVQAARTLARDGRDETAADTLAEASAVLHQQVLPRLAEVRRTGQERLDDDVSAAGTAPLIALAASLVAIAAIVAVHLWLTRRTRRLLNPRLAAGVLALVVVTIAGVVVVDAGRQQVLLARDDALRVADAVVEARFAAFDARSAEALGALGGTTVRDEETWAGSIGDARGHLEVAASDGSRQVRDDVAKVSDTLEHYTGVHDRLLTEAEKGNTARVRQMASNPAPGGAVGAFENFDAYSGALLARQVQSADDAWAASGENLRLVGWLTLGAGLLAAVLGWSGIAARRREYR